MGKEGRQKIIGEKKDGGEGKEMEPVKKRRTVGRGSN